MEETKPGLGRQSALARERDVVTQTLTESATLSDQSLPRLVALIDRFCAFAERAFGIRSLGDVTSAQATSFIQASTTTGDPAVATLHLRRSAVRLLFRVARQLDLASIDPTVDLVLPPRSGLKARPLTGDEVALCRAASLHTLASSRLAAAWALAEASARSSELGHIRVGDIDLEGALVWLPGGRAAEPRSAPLGEWARTQLQRRVGAIGREPSRMVLYDGRRGTDYHRQAASCAAIGHTLRLAGLSDEPDLRPRSVVAWAGRQVFEETGRIEVVAARLGMRSLDRAARMIDWNWQPGASA